ncbi:MAG: dihydroneopterin aldolase [Caulobacterales bacterium]
MNAEQSIRVLDVPTELRVGVSDKERAHPQSVRISVVLTLHEPPNFADHDRLCDTIDYDHIIRFIQHTLPAEGPTRLIETLADRTAKHCLSLSARVAGAQVSVAKPSVLGTQGEVSVVIMRLADHAEQHHTKSIAEANR